MIWINGQLVAHDRLALPIADRVFEHGLGLFETFRTWNGKAPLLGHHLDRMQRSAQALGILVDQPMPTAGDVERLVEANRMTDALVRLTASAGRPPNLGASTWMSASPLPPEPPRTGYRVVDAPWPVAIDDPLARHKTLNYWSKRIAFEQAQASGADEAVFASSDGRIWEGSRSNLFVVSGRDLITPPESGPIIPGIMRRVVLDLAGSFDISAGEAEITGGMIDSADEIFLTNSVRGLIPVGSWAGRAYRPADPSFPRTSRLRAFLMANLTSTSPRP